MDLPATLHRRFSLQLLLLVGVSYVVVARLGERGLVLVLALFIAALPFLLRPLIEPLQREALGALFLLLVACYAETIDTAFGWQQRVSTVILLMGAVYIVQRRRAALEVLYTPVGILLTLFFVQQALNALALTEDDQVRVIENRASILLTALAIAVLVRQPGGEKLVPAVALLAFAMSVPVLLREVNDPNLLYERDLLFVGQDARAGGFYRQPNNAGVALTFGLAFAWTLAPKRSTLLLIVVLLGAGIFCCASRGALGIFAVLALFGTLAGRLRVGDRRAIAFILLALLPLTVFRAPVAAGLVRVTDALQGHVPAIARLQEVIVAFSGDTSELTDDDSQRIGIAQQAIHAIAERPIFGHGTANFFINENEQRSHVQFLEVLGENGLVGGAFYAALLAALAVAAVRAPRDLRLGALMVFGAWFLTNFDNHNIVDTRFLIVPLAYVWGLDAKREPDPLAEA